MRLRKRCLAAFLTLAMLFTLIPFGSVFAEGSLTLSDVDPNTTTGKAVAELSKLNIINGYEDGTFRPDNTITRGEIAKIIISFKKQQDIAFDTLPSGFADVDSVNHWAKKYIKLAADQKIVNGYPDGTFLADNPVRYTEIVKMLVCMLGYGAVAEQRTAPGAAWYSGYMAVAAEKGILQSASVNNVEDYASRAVVSILTYNCLEVETATTDSEGNIIINQGSTALEQYQGKEKVTGVVTGVQQTGIRTGDTGLAKREVTVEVQGEETVYTVPVDTDVMAFLGRRISAYAEDTGAEHDALSQLAVTKTESIEVKPNLIDSVSDSSIKYYETETSSRKETLTLDDVKVIYNGKYDDTFKVDDFKNIQAGTIEFVCNDGDGSAEVAFVSAYETFIVSSVDRNSNPPKIYDKHGNGELSIPYESKNIYFSLTKTDSTSEPAAIVQSLSEWDVISVMKSKESATGRAVWNGIVTEKRVSGKITSSDNDTTKEIKGKYYTFAESYKAYAGAKPRMEVGDHVTIYLNHKDEIVAATASTTETTVTVAYMVAAGKQGGSINATAQVSLYNLTGSTRQTMPFLASSVRIDGVPCNTPDAALSALRTAAEKANKNKETEGIGVQEYCQLIRYTLNSKGEIDMIDTVVPNASPATDDLTQQYPFPYAGNTNKVLKYNGGRFSGSGGLVFMANSSTKVLEIPYDDLTNTEKFRMPSYSSAFTTSADYRAEAYNVSGSGFAQYVISYVGGEFGAETVNEKSPMVVVSEINQYQPENSTETFDKAIGYAFPSAGDATITSEKANMLYGKYSLGDIFRYAMSDEKIVEAQKILSFNAEGGKPIIYDIKDGNRDITAKVDTAEEAMSKRNVKLDDVIRENTATVGRFMYGTLLNWDTNGLVMTKTIKEDTCGVTPDQAKETVFLQDTKVFIYNYGATLDAEKVKANANLDAAKAYEKLVNEGKKDPEAAKAEASQILVYYTGNYSAKAIIIFQY